MGIWGMQAWEIEKDPRDGTPRGWVEWESGLWKKWELEFMNYSVGMAVCREFVLALNGRDSLRDWGLDGRS